MNQHRSAVDVLDLQAPDLCVPPTSQVLKPLEYFGHCHRVFLPVSGSEFHNGCRLHRKVAIGEQVARWAEHEFCARHWIGEQVRIDGPDGYDEDLLQGTYAARRPVPRAFLDLYG